MALAFAKSTPILDFGPRPHPYRYREGKRYLLWPAFAWQVVAPLPRERQLDVLQKHVMNLCKAGERRPEQIARYLGLDGNEAELAVLLVRQLQQMGLLNERSEPTHSGGRILEDEMLARPELLTGYVFQTPWKAGDFWPRFVEQVNTHRAEIEGFDGQRPTVVFGPVGKPQRRHPYVVRVRGDEFEPAQPEPLDVLRAVRQHRRREKLIRRGAGRSSPAADDEAGVEAGESDRGGLPAIQRVSVVGDEPIPVYLLTFAFVPEQSDAGTPWQVCDPFGMGVSPWLRDRVEQRRERDELLRNEIGRLFQEQNAEQLERRRQEGADRRGRAEYAVEERLTVEIRRYEELHGYLADMQEKAEELTELGDGHPSVRGKVRGILNDLGVILEQLFKDIARRFPLADCWERQGLLEENKLSNVERLSQIAQSMGFDVGPRGRLPDSLAYRSLRDIQNAARYADKAANPMLIVTLLAATRAPLHPMHKAAREFPNLLLRVAEITDARNKGGSHAGGRSVTLAETMGYVDTLYRVIQLLLPAAQTA